MSGGAGHGAGFAWRSLAIPVLVLAVLAVWWAFLLPQAERSVFAKVPVLDEVYYLDRAAESSGSSAVYFLSPLYPRLIALAGSGANDSAGPVFTPTALRGIRLLQIFCWLGTVLLLHLIARRTLAQYVERLTGGPWLLWLPSVLFVFYRPASIYAVTILVELPLIFLLTVHWYLLTWNRHRWWPAILAGLTLGLAGLLRGSALALLPVALWTIWTGQVSGRHRLVHLLLLLAATATPLLPPILHNSRQAGRMVGPTLNGGVNLYIGNGPEANGFYVAVVPDAWPRDPAGQDFLAGRLGLPSVSLAQADSIWAATAIQTMAARPGRTFGLWLKKIWLHLQSWEIDQLTPLAGWTREVPQLKLLALPFGWLVVLALAGLAGTVGARGPARAWALGLGLMVGAQSLFFVVSRYRLAMVPLLCLLATAGVLHLLNSWKLEGRRRALLTYVGAVLLAAAICVSWGLDEVRARWVPLAEANEARRWGVIGEQEESATAMARAEELYRSSVAAQSDSPFSWLGLAAALSAQGRRTEAEEVLAKGILRVDRNLEIRRMLVGLLLQDDRRSDALAQAQALLDKYPDDAETLHNATILLANFGNSRDALEMAEKLVAAHPTDPRGAVDLGILLARLGRTDEAREVFVRGLAANPGHVDLLRNLELLGQTP